MTGRGTGGAGGTTCVPGSGTDAGSCNTTFNFENCALYETSIDSDMAQLAFKSIANVRSPTVCGQGAMELSASFSTAAPPDGSSNKGIYGSVTIPFMGDLRGKTVTIHVMAVPGTSAHDHLLFLSADVEELLPRSVPSSG